MSALAIAVRHLIAAGVSGDDLVAAITEIHEGIIADLAIFRPQVIDEPPSTKSAGARRAERYRQRGGGKVPAHVRVEIFERDGYQCLDCGTDERLEIDHVIPVSKGGDPVDPSNLQTLCRSCNAKKRDRIRKADERSLARKNSDVGGNSRTTEDKSQDNIGQRTNLDAAPSLPLPPNEKNSNPPAPTHPDITSGAREAVPFDAHVAARNEALAAGWKPKRKRKVAPPADVPLRPAEVSEQVWSDFLKHRRKLDADLTETALAGFRREADRVGWPLERAIEESILRGWRGFKADWVKRDERSTAGWNGSPSGRPDRRDAISRAIDDQLVQHGMDFGGPAQPARPAGRAHDGQPRIGRVVPYSPD